MLRALARRLPLPVRSGGATVFALARRPGDLRHAFAGAVERRRFRANRARLALPPSPPDAPRVLAVSLSGWRYQLKLEGMLLKALELQGRRPALLTSRPVRRVARDYLGGLGIDHLVELELASRAQPSDLAAEARRLLEGDLSVQRLKSLRYRGANVGQQVLSTLSRNLFRGSVSLDDAEARALVERLLPESMALVHTAERLLDEIEPEVVLFNEARYAGYGPIFEVALARGLNVIQFVSAFSDDALVFKRYSAATSRVHPRSLGEAAWSEVAAGPWTERMAGQLHEQFELRYAGVDQLSKRLHEHTRRRDRDALVAELELDPAKRTAVLFSHVLWDANLFYGDDLFEDQEEWLVETIRSAAANPQLNWVVKLHPANVWKRKLEGRTGALPEVEAIRAKVGALPPHVRLLLPETDVSTLSLFELADFAVTIRGTVGVEAPCFGVSVVTGGTSHYSGRGFTIDSSTADEYRELLRTLHERPRLTDEQTLLAKKHAHALFCRRPLRFTSFRSTIDPDGRGGLLSHDLHLDVSSRAELEAAADLREFATWALDRGREDYLAPLDDPVVDESPLAVAPDHGAGAVEQPGRAQR